MIDSEQLKQNVVKAVDEIRATNPMAGSITNTVTIDFVANAQLAVGGSAAMVYLPTRARRSLPAATPSISIWHALPHLRADDSPRGQGGTQRRQALGARSGGSGHRQSAHPAGK